MNDATPTPASTVYLIDASMYVFRAWHSMPDEFFDVDGNPVNAVHGFARFLLEFVERTRARHAVTAFDIALTSSFRNAIYPAYKANRDPAPPELKRQFQYCRELAAAFGFTVLADATYEADDLIGSMQAALRPHAFRAVIVSADKDFGQLLGDGDEQWDYARGQRWGAAGIPARLGVEAKQVIDYLAITGDASDNIPGVPGIGAKGAAALLAHFGDLETLLARVDEVPFLRLRGAKSLAAKLHEHAGQARMSRQLATIALDAPVPRSPGDVQRRAPDAVALDALFEQLKIGPITRNRAHQILTMDPAS
ncbi:MAG TPA: 5'-3' exonuclease H3TH domain-containing protein [Rhodanobacteraceae bacterium]|jgi:5'-3' exonuclease|nr:5'-3' exonuclease H3TH domain-containing protein [Rhodanobacteraceae bacterium]